MIFQVKVGSKRERNLYTLVTLFLDVLFMLVRCRGALHLKEIWGQMKFTRFNEFSECLS